MSSKPSKWLFDIKRRMTWTELERVFCHWIYFHFRSKYISWPSYGGRSPPSPPPPWIRHWVGFQSEQVVYMLTTSCCQVYSRLRLCGSYVLPTNEQKQSAKSFSFGYFSSETNRQNCSLSRCLFPRTKLWACVSQFPLLWQWLLLKRQHQTVVSTSISETNRKVSK